jgi:hypothetical protein
MVSVSLVLAAATAVVLGCLKFAGVPSVLEEGPSLPAAKLI